MLGTGEMNKENVATSSKKQEARSKKHGNLGVGVEPVEAEDDSYARGFHAHWVSAHSNLERLVKYSIGLSMLKRALR